MIQNRRKTTMYKKYTAVSTVLENLKDTDLSAFDVVTHYDNTDITLSGSLIIRAFKQKYSMFNFVHVNNVPTFKTSWLNFINTNHNNISKIIAAIYATYNPIDNYDKNSEITDTLNRDNAKLTNTNKQTADDTTTFYNDTQSETTQDKPVVNTHTEHTRGNIGVMTTQSMIISEISLRTTMNEIYLLIDMYANIEVI